MKQTNISKELVESFGYVYEESITKLNVAQMAVDDTTMTEGTLGTIAKKSAGPIAIITQIYSAYEQITKIPKETTHDQYVSQVTKIISKLVAEYGLFWVGTIIGGAIAGIFTGGVGTIAGAVAGGLGGLAAYALGADTVDELVEQIVDKLYTNTHEPNTQDAGGQPDTSQPDTSGWPTTDAEIRAFQAENGLTVDGLIGKYTYNALTTQAGLTPPPGFNIVPDKAIANTGQSVSESIAQLRDVLSAIENK